MLPHEVLMTLKSLGRGIATIRSRDDRRPPCGGVAFPVPHMESPSMLGGASHTIRARRR